MDFTKFIKPIILLSLNLGFISSGYATLQSHSYKYIIKLNELSTRRLPQTQEGIIKAKISDLIDYYYGRFIDDSELKVTKIINDLYTIELTYDIDIILPLVKDASVDYLVKDKVSYFEPLKDIEDPNQQAHEHKGSRHDEQWSLYKSPGGINLESAPFKNDLGWSYWQDDNAARRKNNLVVVGVLDTGITDNINLNNNVLPGWNFDANNKDNTDETDSFHGTHVAGIIAAHGPTIYGVGSGDTTVKPNVKILPVKIPNKSGMFYESNVIKAIYWAIGAEVNGAPLNLAPAKVLNMSFGIDEEVGREVKECSPAVQDAIDAATKKNVTLVVAAGNSNLEHDLGSPGGCKGVIRVASTGPTGLRSYFSNYGEGITVAAPGGDKNFGVKGGILSTVNTDQAGDVAYKQGTSMAAPQVAGLIGLIHALNDDGINLSNQEIESLITTNAHEFGQSDDPNRSCTGKKSCGAGIIDADKTLKAFREKYYPA